MTSPFNENSDKARNQADLTGHTSVKIIYGSADGVFSGVAGASLASLKTSLANAFNIPIDVLAFVNGEQVDFDYQVKDGDVVEFCKQFGQKGMNRMFTEAQIQSEYGLPQKLFAELLPLLKPVSKSDNGQVLYLECHIDKVIETLCLRFAPPDDSDRMIPPDAMFLDGRKYDDITTLEYKLMALLIAKACVPATDVIDYIYDHDPGDKDMALTDVIKRLNKKLKKVFVQRINKKVTLVK